MQVNGFENWETSDFEKVSTTICSGPVFTYTTAWGFWLIELSSILKKYAKAFLIPLLLMS